MTRFKIPFLHRPPPPPPEPVVISTNISLDAWCYESHAQSTRFVQKIELCTALCAGDDLRIEPLGEDHYHTLLRVFLGTPSDPDTLEDTLLIERVLSVWGAYHSVTPISSRFITGTPFHPKPQDRICVISEGPSTMLASDLQVERTLMLDDRALTLAQFAQVLAFISRTTDVICDARRCEFHSRSFAFTCLSAFTPTLPPREVVDLEGMDDARKTSREKVVDDSEFEFCSEALLRYVPLIVDPASMRALKMIMAFKYGSIDNIGRDLPDSCDSLR